MSVVDLMSVVTFGIACFELGVAYENISMMRISMLKKKK